MARGDGFLDPLASVICVLRSSEEGKRGDALSGRRFRIFDDFVRLERTQESADYLFGDLAGGEPGDSSIEDGWSEKRVRQGGWLRYRESPRPIACAPMKTFANLPAQL